MQRNREPRSLREISAKEKSLIIRVIHGEAQTSNWHSLGTKEKARFYKRWEDRFALTHAAVKDGIMKGFDVAQRIPPSGEAAIHAELLRHFKDSPIPYIGSKVRRNEWRREVDFVLGFSPNFLTHIVELESASTWQAGLSQCLLYKSLYFQTARVQVLPTLVLFGDASRSRWQEINTVCLDQRVLLLAFRLSVDGTRAAPDISALLDRVHEVGDAAPVRLFDAG